MMTIRAPAVGAVALAVLVSAAAGCTRLDGVNRRLRAIDDDRARNLVRDTVWAHGSKYQWVQVQALRAEVDRTVHRPDGDTTTAEVWLLDPWAGRVRVEATGKGLIEAFDGGRLRVFQDGAETDDPAARARAVADVRLVRELLPMPFSLAGPDCRVAYLAARSGPGEARAWHRLGVRHGDALTPGADDQTIVEIRQATGRVEAAEIRWSALPMAGRPTRVAMDDWQPAGGLHLARRWRFVPVDEAGDPDGAPRCTVRVRRVQLDPPVAPGAFVRPEMRPPIRDASRLAGNRPRGGRREGNAAKWPIGRTQRISSKRPTGLSRRVRTKTRCRRASGRSRSIPTWPTPTPSPDGAWRT